MYLTYQLLQALLLFTFMAHAHSVARNSRGDSESSAENTQSGLFKDGRLGIDQASSDFGGHPGTHPFSRAHRLNRTRRFVQLLALPALMAAKKLASGRKSSRRIYTQHNARLPPDCSQPLPKCAGPLSKWPIVDGRTYTMYHGTSCRTAAQIQRSGFQPSQSGMLGPCVYLSRNIRKTVIYAQTKGRLDGSGPCIIKAGVNVGRVCRISKAGPTQRFHTWLTSGSYDSAWVPPCSITLAPSRMEESCVIKPSRITIEKVFTQPKSLG